jgi:hypothetical protein
MSDLILVLDLLIVCASLAAAWLWRAASRQRVRRISRLEVLDAADINRLVTALNRTQILNARAALTTAAAAVMAAFRVCLDALAVL